MDFLLKKGFHPGTFKNQERVQKREAEKKAEDERIKELQEQIEEERKREDLQRLYTGSVHGKNAKAVSGLEWMYSAPMQTGADDYLMGKKYEEDKPDLQAELNKTGLEAASSAARPATDDWARSHNDPMLAIKLAEKQALDALTSNPVKMARLREALGIKDKSKKRCASSVGAFVCGVFGVCVSHHAMRSKKKKDKKDKKHKKRHRSRSRSRSGSRSRRRSRSPSAKARKRRSRSRSPDVAVKREQTAAPLVVPAGYGLQFPGGKPPPAPTAATRAVGEGAVAVKVEPVVERPKHRRAQPLTEAERADRLRQMTLNAQVVEQSRAARVVSAAASEQQVSQRSCVLVLWRALT